MSQSLMPPLSCRCAGICYPRDRDECIAYFRQFFDSPQAAPWPTGVVKSAEPLLGILTPHIDFRVSTIAYSYAFAPLLLAPWADLYVILGVGHHGRQEWSVDGRDYATPFGLVPVEAGLASDLVREVGFSLGDHASHEGEHSIEFPLVLLQSLRRAAGIDRPFSFLPVLCGGMFEAVELGIAPPPTAQLFQLAAALKKLLAAYGSRVHLIVSIDGCHLGPRFGHRYRVNPARLEATAAWEELLWQRVQQADLDGFLRHLGEDANARYFDGVGALSLFLAMFGSQAELHRTHYEQWFEPRDASAVTFTSGYFLPKEASKKMPEK
jgi:MEMO1 family protein